MAPGEAARHLETAKRAADLAARRLLASREDLRGAVSSAGHDIKIKGDAAAEAVLLAHLGEASPFGVLSEEGGEISGRTLSGPRWVVDPLDGSLNFNRDIPLCCVSVSLWDGERPVLGVVHDFNRGEVFSGIVGEGAWLDGRPIRVSGVERKADAVLCTGFPVYTDFSAEALAGFLEHVRAYKKVRLLGSAALSLAWVAAGRADAYMENNIMLWDVAGGLALVAAAGGRIEMEPLGKGLRIKAGNGRV